MYYWLNYGFHRVELVSTSRFSTKMNFYNARPANFVPTQACSESVPRSSSSRAGGGDLGGMSDLRLLRLVDWRSDGNRSGSHHSMPWPARSEQSAWVMVSCRVGKTGKMGDVVDGNVDLAGEADSASVKRRVRKERRRKGDTHSTQTPVAAPRKPGATSSSAPGSDNSPCVSLAQLPADLRYVLEKTSLDLLMPVCISRADRIEMLGRGWIMCCLRWFSYRSFLEQGIRGCRVETEREC